MTDEEFYEKKNNTKKIWKQVVINGEKQNYDVSNTGEIRNHTTKFNYKLTKTQGMKNCYEFYTMTLNDGSNKNMSIHRLMAIMFIPIPKKYIKKGFTVDKLVVDHKDNVKYHNILENLQWLTNKENVKKWYMDVASINDLTISDKTVHKVCKDLVKGLTIYEISQKYDISELLVHDIRFKLRHRDISDKYKFPSRQISEDDAIKICELLQEGLSTTKISENYGYPISVVTHILAGNSWKNISKNYIFPTKSMSDDVVIKVCEMLQDNISPKDIAEKLNVGVKAIKCIKWGQTHTDISKNYNFTNNSTIYSDELVEKICIDIEKGELLLTDIAKKYNVRYGYVKQIKRKIIRKDIVNKYSW